MWASADWWHLSMCCKLLLEQQVRRTIRIHSPGVPATRADLSSRVRAALRLRIGFAVLVPRVQWRRARLPARPQWAACLGGRLRRAASRAVRQPTHGDASGAPGGQQAAWRALWQATG